MSVAVLLFSITLPRKAEFPAVTIWQSDEQVRKRGRGASKGQECWLALARSKWLTYHMIQGLVVNALEEILHWQEAIILKSLFSQEVH